MRRALAAVLASPDDHEVQESKDQGSKLRPHECATCCAAQDAINFTDEDLLLGSKPHNRPLFISGYIREHNVKHMLVDGGSAINIMPKSTMTAIGIKVDERSLSRLLIQGFNQGGQRAMGMIQVEMTIGELKSSTIFHVIDARTSYNLLLGVASHAQKARRGSHAILQAKTMMSLLNLEQPKGVGHLQKDRTHQSFDISRCREERTVNPRSKMEQAKPTHNDTRIM